jgi:hypothetical protein
MMPFSTVPEVVEQAILSTGSLPLFQKSTRSLSPVSPQDGAVAWKMYGATPVTIGLSLFVISNGVEVAMGTGA